VLAWCGAGAATRAAGDSSGAQCWHAALLQLQDQVAWMLTAGSWSMMLKAM
jgi:hypothetical protein